MIKDEKQYKFTSLLALEFAESLAAQERDETRKQNDPDGWELIKGSLQCHIDKFKAEIAE